MRRSLALAAAAILFASPAFADPVGEAIAAAGQAYQRGELIGAATSLQTALDIVQQRLAENFLPLMPAAPAGWQEFEATADAAGIAGGGMTVMKGYEMGDASLNASIIVDSLAVSGIAELLANPAAIGAQTGMTRVKLDAGMALMRWDDEDKSGEIMLVLGEALLIQVVGNGIDRSDVMVDMMTRWNIAAVRRQAGL